jgi:hypothetical protein
MKVLLIILLICYASSVRIKQMELSEILVNITGPFRPIFERNITSIPETRPDNRSRQPSFPERESEFPESGRIRLPLRNETVAEGPIWSNRSLLLGQPPVNPEGFWSEKYRIIPPQFWDQNLTDAVVFVNNDGRALSCEKDGDLKLTRVSRQNKDHLWFPEMLKENIIRLRSYYGGYLSWDVNRNSLTCHSRDRNFLSRWEVLLQISDTKRNQCLFLLNRGKFLGFDQKKLVWENWTGDHNKFCFFGMPTSLTNWVNKPRYIYTFDPSKILGKREGVNQ